MNKKKRRRVRKPRTSGPIKVSCKCGWKGDGVELVSDDDNNPKATLRCPQCHSCGWEFE